jgi:hypothetical protein
MNPARHTTAAAVALSVAGGLLAGATNSASAAASCASPVYTRQFFANTTFSGTAKKTDCDNAIDQTWTGAPASGLPKDNFDVRWSVTRDFGDRRQGRAALPGGHVGDVRLRDQREVRTVPRGVGDPLGLSTRRGPETSVSGPLHV